MKAVMWRLDDRDAALYTEDREVLRALVGLANFPLENEAEAMQYMAGNRRVFAWQVNFETKHWLRVMRLLGRDQVQIHPDSAPLTRWPADTGVAEAPSTGLSVTDKRPVSRSVNTPDSAKERGKQAAKDGSPVRADASGATKRSAPPVAADPKNPPTERRVRAVEPEPVEDAGPTPAEVAAALRRLKAGADAPTPPPVAGAKGGERKAAPPTLKQIQPAAKRVGQGNGKKQLAADARSAPAPAVEVPAAKSRSGATGKGNGEAAAAPPRERVKTPSAPSVAPTRTASAGRGTAVATAAKPAPAVAAARTGARPPVAAAARAGAAKPVAASAKVAETPPKAAAGRPPARSTSGTTSRSGP